MGTSTGRKRQRDGGEGVPAAKRSASGTKMEDVERKESVKQEEEEEQEGELPEGGCPYRIEGRNMVFESCKLNKFFTCSLCKGSVAELERTLPCPISSSSSFFFFSFTRAPQCPLGPSSPRSQTGGNWLPVTRSMLLKFLSMFYLSAVKCLSIFLSKCLSIYLSIDLSIYLGITGKRTQ